MGFRLYLKHVRTSQHADAQDIGNLKDVKL